MKNFSELIGWIGTTLIVIAYFLISYNFLLSSSLRYQSMNLIGASALFYAAYKKKSASIATLQIIWALIALFALVRIIT